jgi:hypothetical protein
LCNAPIHENSEIFDKHLRANLKNGKMSRRKTCYECKSKEKLAKKANKKTAAGKTNAKSTNAAKRSAKSSAALSPSSSNGDTNALATLPGDCETLSFDRDRYILRIPSFSGKRTTKIINAGEEVTFTEQRTLQYADHDGTPRFTTFFRLADGRGWVHNCLDESLFSPNPPHSDASPTSLTATEPTRDKPHTNAAPTIMLVPPPPIRPPFIVEHYKDFFASCSDCGESSHDDSGSCPYCLKPIAIYPLCTLCGQQSEDLANDLTHRCHSCTNHLFFLPILPAPPNFVLSISHTDIGIRTAAAYPGVRTGDLVKPNETLPFTASSILDHTHTDGKVYSITFYQLADGRGWIHDFDPTNFDRRSLTRGWINSLNPAESPAFTTSIPPLPFHLISTSRTHADSTSPPKSR